MAKLIYGSLAFTTPVETTLASSTPVKAEGITTSLTLGDFTMPQNNRLTYVGTITRDFQIIIALSSIKSSGGATDGIFHVYKNGILIPGITIERTIQNTSDIGAIPLLGAVPMSENDYVELWIETVNGDNMTITKGQIIINVLG